MLVKLYYILFCVSYIYAISTYFIGLLLNIVVPLYGFAAILVSVAIVCILDSKINSSNRLGNIFKLCFLILPLLLVFILKNPVIIIHHCIMCILIIYMFYKFDGKISHYEVALKFKLCFFIYMGSFCLQLIGATVKTSFLNNSIIMFVIFLYISVLFIRLLRDRKHNKIGKDYINKQIRQLGLFIIVTFIISYRQILAKTVLVFASIVYFIFSTIINFINTGSFFEIAEINELMQNIMLSLQPAEEESGEVLELSSYAPPLVNQILTYTFYFIVVAFIIKLMIDVINKLLHYKKVDKTFDGLEVIREKIKPDKKTKADKNADDSKRQKIRRYYRSFIKACVEKKILINDFDTTNDISVKYCYKLTNNNVYEKQFRDNYLNARYNTKESILSEDVKRSKELLSKLH